MTKLEDARNCVLQNAQLSPGVCGAFKPVVPILCATTFATTCITKQICDKIVRIYNYEHLSGMSTFFGVVIGAANGAKLTTRVLDFFPGTTVAPNAIAIFTLHLVTGIVVIAVCELLDEGVISNTDIQNSAFGTVSKILGAATSVVSGFARGDYYDAIRTVKDAYHESVSNGIIASDVMDYNSFITHAYTQAFRALSPTPTEEETIIAAANAYRQIYERNCNDGLWSFDRGFDNTLTFYIAGYVKDKIECSYLRDLSQEQVAYRISETIQGC